MKDLDYIYICTVIGNMSGIPIRLYEDNRLTFYHSFVYLPKDPLTPFENNILAIETHIGYFITPYFHYYGIVSDGKHKIVIGPTIQTANNEQTLKELASKCNVSSDDTIDFIIGIKSIVSMPLDSILQILCTMNYIMNDEKLGLEDIIIYDAEQQDLKGNTGHPCERGQANIFAIFSFLSCRCGGKGEYTPCQSSRCLSQKSYRRQLYRDGMLVGRL